MSDFDALLAKLPNAWPETLQPRIRERFLASGRTLVVLDDDPTGTQTVHDVPVITTWEGDHVRDLFVEEVPLFYILTNTRGYSTADAQAVNERIAEALVAAQAATGRPFTVVSRSDSTLRGHYPLETDVLAEALQLQDAPLLLAPFFEEGGRLTLNDVHYVIENGKATPAAETPFAKDAVFGFSHSHLPSWVEEKTNGKVRAAEVRSISLEAIRQGGPSKVSELLSELEAGQVCIINAVAMADMEVVASAIHEHRERGGEVLLRSAASIVRALAGLPKRPLLEPEDMVVDNGNGGLIVVGSHVPKSTAQFERLVSGKEVEVVELGVEEVLEEKVGTADIAKEIDAYLQAGRNVVLVTSRKVALGSDDRENMRISQQVSAALVATVSAITIPPRFLIAKGGITSSDIASKALGVTRAMVLGQLLPGVPVWRLGEETRFPGLGYVVFPGNVGGEEALLESVRRLRA